MTKNIYNPGMGDVDEQRGRINDVVVTNNLDQKKVFDTVATIIQLFFENYPAVSVLIKGSTESRTRLYKMQLSGNLLEIDISFIILGYKQSVGWEKFDKTSTEYEAFMIRKK